MATGQRRWAAVIGGVCALVWLGPADAHGENLNHGRTVQGLFGERVLGRPLTPQPRTRFERGIQRSPSGVLVGIGPHSRFHYTPRARGVETTRRAEPIVIVPDTGRRAVPDRTRLRVEAGRTPAVERPQPTRRPPAGRDIWFRSRMPSR